MMRCIKLLSCLLLSVGLFACQSLSIPGFDRKSKNEKSAIEKSFDEQMVNEAVSLQDPYLSQTVHVEPSIQKAFEKALSYMRLGEYQYAVDILEPLTQRAVKLSGLWVNLAVCYAKLGKSSQVESAFKQAVSANAQNYQAYNHYGLWLRDQGRFDEAKVQYQNGLTVWSEFLGLNINMALLLDVYLHQPGRALPYYEKALALAKQDDKHNRWVEDLQRWQKEASTHAARLAKTHSEAE